jgi:DNA/RNA-binding domain of Phe-tRNA-synthetase-like protein
MNFNPVVDDAVLLLAPGFKALSLIISRPDGQWHDRQAGALALAKAVDSIRSAPDWADAHLAAWAETFRAFGAKPQRTPCSAQGLRDRVVKTGTLGSINPVVDLYNSISLKFAVPVGGENCRAYKGNARLVIADGNETFDTLKNGENHVETPEVGEVVWRDDIGVTCRRWNWRQGLRTRLDETATEMWFVLESLPEMPLSALEQAGAELLLGLRQLFGEIESATVFLERR